MYDHIILYVFANSLIIFTAGLSALTLGGLLRYSSLTYSLYNLLTRKIREEGERAKEMLPELEDAGSDPSSIEGKALKKAKDAIYKAERYPELFTVHEFMEWLLQSDHLFFFGLLSCYWCRDVHLLWGSALVLAIMSLFTPWAAFVSPLSIPLAVSLLWVVRKLDG